MKPDQRAEVIRLATDVGVPADVFAGWVEGEELGIHRQAVEPGLPGRNESQKNPEPPWVLDLGGRPHPLTQTQAEALEGKLKAAGIKFASFPVTNDYLQRKGEQ